MLRKIKMKQKMLLAFLTLIPTSLILTACGRSGGPVSRLIPTTFYYTTETSPAKTEAASSKSSSTSRNTIRANTEKTTNQWKAFSINADIGDPSKVLTTYQIWKPNTPNSAYAPGTGNWVGLEAEKDVETKNKATFFATIAKNFFTVQNNATLSRASLIRSYYAWINNRASTSKVTDEAALTTYFGSKDANLKLFNSKDAMAENSNQNGTSSVKLSALESQFAYAITDSLAQGDGFGGNPRSISFAPSSAVLNLGNLGGVDFSKAIPQVTGENLKPSSTQTEKKEKVATTASETKAGFSRFSLQFTINGTSQTQNYIKLTIPQAYLNYQFIQNGSDSFLTKDNLNVVNDYLKVAGNQDLIPAAFHNFKNDQFNVESTSYSSLFNVTENQQAATEADKAAAKSYNLIPINSFAWNSFTQKDKLYNDSLVKISTELENSRKSSINNLDLSQVTLDHYFANGYYSFPNEKLINEIANHLKIFTELNPNAASSEIDWSAFRKLKINDLLFSLFSDFKFNSNFSKLDWNSASPWVQTLSNADIVKKIEGTSSVAASAVS